MVVHGHLIRVKEVEVIRRGNTTIIREVPATENLLSTGKDKEVAVILELRK